MKKECGKLTGERERDLKSSLLISDLKDDKLRDSGKEQGKTFRKLHVLGMNDKLWDRACKLVSETWKVCE